MVLWIRLSNIVRQLLLELSALILIAAGWSNVNNRGWYPAGRGSGFTNEGPRGRGNYGGGRTYNCGDRPEFSNRPSSLGVFSNRGDAYQRGDNMGSNGGCVNRAGGPTVTSAAKTVAPRVSAPA